MTRRERIALTACAGVAFGLRVWSSGAFAHDPPLLDPDGYSRMSRLLVDQAGWHWNRHAVQFAEFVKAPLYQVLLSALWRISGVVPFVNAALVLHALLNASTSIALYIIGSRLHNRRAGLIAAAAYAVWLANIVPTAIFWQEQVFIPMVCWAMAVLATAIDTREPSRWVSAGVMFGVTALARSSIAYFVVPAALLMAVTAKPRRQAVNEAALLLAGFALLVVPYVVYISTVTHRLIFIENIGYFSLKRSESMSPVDPHINLIAMMRDQAGPPTTGEVLHFLWRDFAVSPGAFVLRRIDFLRLLVKPGGQAFLANQFAATARSASLMRVAIHALLDLPLVTVLVLAPIGAALARQCRLALTMLLWPPVYLGLVALMIWAGTRYRAPVEPVLLALAAVVFAGEWRVPPRPWLSAAGAASLAVAALVGLSLPSMLSARANYGVAMAPSGQASQPFVGAMGAYVASTGNVLGLSLSTEAPDAVAVTVLIDGKKVDAFSFSGSTVRRYTFPSPRRVYLEIAAAAGGGAVPMAVRLE